MEVPLALGIGYAYIKLKRNEEVQAFDFINLAFSNFGRAWKIGLRELVKMLLPVIGMIVGLLIIVFAGVYSTASAMIGTAAEPSIGLIVVGFILYVVSIIWLAVRSLLYAVTTMVAYDNPSMRSLEVVNESARLMKGNRGKYFLLGLSFAAWFIIPIVMAALGLALPAIIVLLALYVWLFPYMQVAYICFYDELVRKDSNNNNTETNTESNDEAITEM